MKHSTIETPYTESEVKEIVANLDKNPAKPRVWEIDALRGLLIMLVVFDHLMYTLAIFRSYYNLPFMVGLGNFAYEYRCDSGFLGVLRGGMHDTFVIMFIFISGISCSFSRNNLKRGLKIAGVALLITGATNAYDAIMQSSSSAINFNVIHVLAICILLWAGIDWLYNKLLSNKLHLNLFGGVVVAMLIAIIVLGYYYRFSPASEENVFGALFVAHKNREFSPGDYFPLFPALAWFIMGGFLGKSIYREKTSLLPNASYAVTKSLSTLGRYSLWIYLISQVVMLGGVYLLAVVMGVL